MPRKLDVVTHNCNPRVPEWDVQWGPQLSSQLVSKTLWERKESHSLRTEAIQEGSLPIFFLIPEPGHLANICPCEITAAVTDGSKHSVTQPWSAG